MKVMDYSDCVQNCERTMNKHTQQNISKVHLRKLTLEEREEERAIVKVWKYVLGFSNIVELL